MRMKDPRLWLAVVALAFAAWLVVPRLVSKRPPPVDESVIPEGRYVCRESGEVFSLPLVAAVREHPVTGRSSLVPAVWDRRRKQWVPGPPPEVMHRNGLLGKPP